MQTHNLGFTCGRLDPKVYKAILEAGKQRGLKTSEVIELVVKVASLVSKNRETYLTLEGQIAVGELLPPLDKSSD